MKKLSIIGIILLSGAVSLWADPAARIFELGFNAGAGFGNSFIGMEQVFQKTMEIDLTQDPAPLFFDLGAGSRFFINLNIQEKLGFGMFAGVDALGQLGIPKDLQEFLRHNDIGKTYEGDIGTGGAIFFEAGAHGYFSINQFRISLRPAYYVPVMYLKPNSHYRFETRDDGTGALSAEFTYDLALYTPFAPSDNSDDLNLDNFDMSNLSDSGGVDLAVAVDYLLLPNLTLGATITHIPVFPAELTHYTSITGGKELYSDNFLNELLDGGNLEDLLHNKEIDSSHGSLMIFRPFKFGVNAVYTPFADNRIISFDLIPQIGYAYNEIYLEPHSFEVMVKARAGLFNVMKSNPLFIFTVGTGYEDKLWKHSLDFVLNLRAFQLDIGVALQSEDFLKSFQGSGLAVNAGFIFGW
jgi:hypothetical protein